MNIWEFNHLVSQRLFNINMINYTLGQQLRKREGMANGIGTQAVAWSVINIGIALVGGTLTRNRFNNMEDPLEPQVMRKETNSLRKILAINTVLDIGYMWGGYKFAKRTEKSVRKGHGWGVVIQGFLLFAFDLYHLLKMSKIRNG